MSNSQEDKPLQSEVPDATRAEPPHVSPAQGQTARRSLDNKTSPEREDAVTARLAAGSGSLEPPVKTPQQPRPKTDTVNIPNAGRMVAEHVAKQAISPFDEHADYQLWLEGKSREELIEMLVELDDQHLDPESTQTMTRMRGDQPEDANQQSYEMPDNLAFIRLPSTRKTPIERPAPTWWIVLVNLEQNDRPLGLIVEGEITIGRAGTESEPDLDLSRFDAKRKGVSRLHARMHPSINSLMLIDSDSSNGTFWNRMRLSAHSEQPLRDGDVIAFGRANFLLKVVKAPSFRETKTLI